MSAPSDSRGNFRRAGCLRLGQLSTGVLAQAHRVQVPGDGAIRLRPLCRHAAAGTGGARGVAFRGGSTFTVPAWNRGWGWGTPAFGYGYHSSGITLGVGGAGLSLYPRGDQALSATLGDRRLSIPGVRAGAAAVGSGNVGVPWAPGSGQSADRGSAVAGAGRCGCRRSRWAPAISPFVGAGPFMQPFVPWVPQVFVPRLRSSACRRPRRCSIR